MATQQARIETGTALEKAIDDEAAAIEATKVAARTVIDARKEALKAGWTERELRQLGLLSITVRGSARTKTNHGTEPAHD